MLATRERRNETGALLVGSEREERKRDGARVHRHRDTYPGIRARELLEHEDVGEEVGAGAAVLLGHTHAEQSQLRELRHELVGKAVLAIPLGGVRCDLRLRQLACQRLDGSVIGGELEVHRPDYRSRSQPYS